MLEASRHIAIKLKMGMIIFISPGDLSQVQFIAKSHDIYLANGYPTVSNKHQNFRLAHLLLKPEPHERIGYVDGNQFNLTRENMKIISGSRAGRPPKIALAPSSYKDGNQVEPPTHTPYLSTGYKAKRPKSGLFHVYEINPKGARLSNTKRRAGRPKNIYQATAADQTTYHDTAEAAAREADARVLAAYAASTPDPAKQNEVYQSLAILLSLKINYPWEHYSPPKHADKEKSEREIAKAAGVEDKIEWRNK